MKDFFAPDGLVMRFFDRLLDLVLVSVLCAFSCIPVITIGCAFTASYYAVSKAVYRGNGHVVRAYLHGFVSNWKQGLGIGVLLDALIALMLLNLSVILRNDMGIAGTLFGAVFFAILILVISFMSYCYPLLARFECRWLALFQTVVQFALSYRWKTVQLFIIEILLVGTIAAGLLLMPIVVLLLPGLLILAQVQVLEPVLQQYMTEGGEMYGEEIV